jgi:hypothetical protein
MAQLEPGAGAKELKAKYTTLEFRDENGRRKIFIELNSLSTFENW